MRSKNILLIVSYIIKIVLLGSLVLAAIDAQWGNIFLIVLVLVVTFLPAFLEKNHASFFPAEFEFPLILFVFVSLFLGDVHGFYTRFWWWDVLTHGISSLLLGFVGFLVLYALYRSGKLGMKPFLIAVFSFAFGVAIGVTWEIYEFLVDLIFGFDMQRSSLVDTMTDLMIDAGGAFIVSLFGYLYITRKQEGKGFFGRLVRKVLAS